MLMVVNKLCPGDACDVPGPAPGSEVLMHEQPNAGGGFLTSSEVVAGAAIRRANFMRDEVESGRVPQSHPLAVEYLEQADRLEQLYTHRRLRAVPPHPACEAADGATVTMLHPRGGES